MKKVLIRSTLASVFAFMSANSYAVGESTLSLDYVQNHIRGMDEKPKGFNIKYRYEIDNHWGAIGSFAYTNKEFNDSNSNADFHYYSLNAGPVYRFNEYISAYGLIGMARETFEIKESNVAFMGLAYGVGLQFNPAKNIAIDASYEYSEMKEMKINTWMIGFGYRF
ncbi:MAG: Ail/Lom family outer membrane beta-barrel protein [Candidatus Phlomobacter fragariae]